MVEKDNSLKNSLWAIADNSGQQVLSFVIFTVLARWLTPQAFGLLAIAHLQVQFVRLAVLDALALPVLRSEQADASLFSWLFTQCTWVSLVFAGLMALGAPALATYFESRELLPIIFGMSGVIVLYGLARAHDAILLRQARFKLLALRSLFSVAAGGVVAIVLAYRGHGALALVAQQITTTTVALIVAFCSEWRQWRPRWHFSMILMRKYGRESMNASASSMLSYANGNGDAALVSIVLGPHATGLYNLAKRVTLAVSLMISASLSRVAASLFFKDSSDTAKLGEHYRRMTALTMSGLVLIYGLIANFSEPITRIVFGPQWLSAAPILTILSMGGIFQSLFNLGQNLSMATGHARRAVRFGGMQLTAAIALSLLLTWKGLIGMALGFGIAAVISACLMHRVISQQLHLHALRALNVLLPPLLGVISLTLISQLTRMYYGPVASWWSLIAVNSMAAAGYLALFLPSKLIVDKRKNK